MTSTSSQEILGIGKSFSARYGYEPIIIRSPGRVNIIGEHTDYNEGFVLPAAIDKAAYVAIGNRTDNTINLYAEEFGESFTTRLDSIQPAEIQWPNYILGVVNEFVKGGYPLSGFDLLLDGNVPIGAGMSSSAAVECATAFALASLFHLNIDKLELVKMAQRAEHEYAGVKCGIMDQFASMFGKKDHAIKLDCRSLQYEYVPLNMKGIKIVLLNTNVKHSLSSSEYNTRREQCEAGVQLVKQKYPQVASLRDITPGMLDECVLTSDQLIYKRCRYVVEENHRLLSACEDLKNGHLESLGKKMFETHEGLSKEYEVSCKELDILVDAVKSHPNVLGARMMGGGFGGCTINLVKESGIDDLIMEVSKTYQQQTGLELTVYVAGIEDGSSIVYSSKQSTGQNIQYLI